MHRILPFAFSAIAVMLSAVDAAAQPTPLRAGGTATGALSAGDTARYTIEAGENFFAFGEVDQRSVDVVVWVLGPDGEQVMRADALGRGGERFSGELSDAGVYAIQVIAAEDDGTGDFAITIHRLEPLAKDPKKLADQLMAPYDGEDSPGAAVQVWRDGRCCSRRRTAWPT